MKPLPEELLALLQTLPEGTCRIVLNTNQQGHWEIEAVTHLKFDEDRLTVASRVDMRMLHRKQY